jgi:uncharacterized protein YcgI (DUF1989 family)
MISVNNHIINPQSAKAFSVKANQLIKLIDPVGHQTGDFFAVSSSDPSEYFSAGATIDCNGKIYLNEKDFLYSNRYNKLLQIEEDKVGTHDLIHPTCSQRMYELHYGVDKPHPSCHQNIRDCLKEFGVEYKNLTTVFNFFMNARIDGDGKIVYNKAVVNPGRFITLRACTDLIIAVTSCSVTQSVLNNFTANPIMVELIEAENRPDARA